MLNDRLTFVRQRIHQACQRCGRDPSTVTLVGVTKGVQVQTIQEAVALGLADLGENRVQEARQKQVALGSRLKARGVGLQPTASSLEPIRWHLIGHLQRNKVKDAVEMFQVIHSVDSIRLAEELERHAAKWGQGAGDVGQGETGPSPRAPRPTPSLPIDVFIQVNLSGEATRFGCREPDAAPLAEAVARLPHLRLTGLMTIPPYSDDMEETRPYFRRLRELRDALPSPRAPRPAPLKLSMGMSQDFEVAIEEGADFVRIGTALFGERNREGQGA